jgi:hypothetical protein
MCAVVLCAVALCAGALCAGALCTGALVRCEYMLRYIDICFTREA